MADEVLQEKVSSLIGKPIRVYTTVDALTEDYIEERVNIEVSKEGKIVRIRRG